MSQGSWHRWIICDHNRYRIPAGYGKITIYEVDLKRFGSILEEHEWEFCVYDVDAIYILQKYTDEDVYSHPGVIREDAPHCALLIEPPERPSLPSIPPRPLEEFKFHLLTYVPWAA